VWYFVWLHNNTKIFFFRLRPFGGVVWTKKCGSTRTSGLYMDSDEKVTLCQLSLESLFAPSYRLFC